MGWVWYWWWYYSWSFTFPLTIHQFLTISFSHIHTIFHKLTFMNCGLQICCTSSPRELSRIILFNGLATTFTSNMARPALMRYWIKSTISKFWFGQHYFSKAKFSIAAAPAFPGLHCFPHGQHFKQWTGDDSKVLMKVSLTDNFINHLPDFNLQVYLLPMSGFVSSEMV